MSLMRSQTVYTDISYSLLEFDLSFSTQSFFQLKTNLNSDLFTVNIPNTISSFIIPFINVLYPTSTSDYYRGKKHTAEV